MRVDELLRSLLKRPLALLMILALAAAGAYFGFNRATNTYESSASVLIVPPGATAADGSTSADNPFTRLDYSIAQLALVVGSQLNSDAVRDQVVSVGGDGAYSATTLSSDNSAVAQLSPIVKLSATSATAEGAQKAIGVLVDQAGAQLAAVQSASNVPTDAQAQVVLSTPATASGVVGNPQVRSAGVFGIAAGFAGLLALVALQPVFGRKRPAAAAAVRTTARPPVPVDVRPPPPPPRSKSARPGTAADRRPENQTKQRGPVFHDRRATDAGRFAEPAVDQPAAAAAVDRRADETPTQGRRGDDSRPVEQPAATEAEQAPMTQRRQEVLRQMVREDWQRSGSNVPWSRREQREAYQRAEERLAEKERQRRDLDESVSRLDDYLEYREHG